MNTIVFKNAKKLLVVLLVSLCIYLPIAFLLIGICTGVSYNNVTLDSLLQRFLYNELKKSFENNGQIPKTILDLDLPQDTREYIHHYNADAWRDSGRILFWHRRGGPFYSVTFGDGH